MVDCSFVASLALPDEQSANARTFFGDAAEGLHVALAPGLLWYELANVMAVAVRRRRLAHAQAATALRLFGRLGITTDGRPNERLASDLFATSRAHGLSGYDAAYLELALREGAAIATADARLAAAARKVGLPVIG